MSGRFTPYVAAACAFCRNIYLFLRCIQNNAAFLPDDDRLFRNVRCYGFSFRKHGGLNGILPNTDQCFRKIAVQQGKKRENGGEISMDALVLSCGTGGGHDSAGKAITEELKCRGHNVQMINPYILQSQQLAHRINSIYTRTVQKMPGFFGGVYRIGQFYRRLPFRSPVYFANRGMVSAMQDYFESNHFDIVISTHLFPAEIITNMKHCGLAVPKTMFVATDYTCIPFTEETECDAYVVPSESLIAAYEDRGTPSEKLYPIGIPVQRSFS